MCVDIGPGVLGLALLQQNVGNYLIQLAHEPEERVLWKMFLSKESLAHVARVRLTQHSMTITRNNLKQKINDSHTH